MYPLNFPIVLASALIPMLIGFVWFHPKVMGTVWARVSGTTEEKMKNSNMLAIFLISLLLSAMMSVVVMTNVIHQIHVYSMLMGNPDLETAGTPLHTTIAQLMNDHGQNFRTFRHGLVHGAILAIFFVLPVIGIVSLFERRGAKYIFVHLGYWLISLMLMGGVISAFA